MLSAFDFGDSAPVIVCDIVHMSICAQTMALGGIVSILLPFAIVYTVKSLVFVG